MRTLVAGLRYLRGGRYAIPYINMMLTASFHTSWVFTLIHVEYDGIKSGPLPKKPLTGYVMKIPLLFALYRRAETLSRSGWTGRSFTLSVDLRLPFVGLSWLM